MNEDQVMETIQEPLIGIDLNDSFDKTIDDIFRLMNTYEVLVIEIENEAKKFREENQSLRENLAAIIVENNRLKNDDVNDPLGAFRLDYIDNSEKIFDNLRNQIFQISKEKEMFENLWKNTSATLQREVPYNSITKLKTDHSIEIKRLTDELTTVKIDQEKQSKINKFLQSQVQNACKKLEAYQMQNLELRKKLKTTLTEKEELEKDLTESNEMNKEQMQRATEVFVKLQESIKVAEEAISEMAALSQEKQQMEDECNHLAQTVGSVMESASEQVAKDIEKLKAKHQEDMGSSMIEIERLSRQLELEKARTREAKQESEKFQEKLNSIDSRTLFFGQDFQTAIQTIMETETKLSLMKQAIENQKEICKSCELEIGRLKKIIKNNESNRDKYKELIFSVAKKLEERIKNLIIENESLRQKSMR